MPRMASAPPLAPQSPSSAPASAESFRNELTACLALVVPVGMTEEGRREWLLAAWEAVGHLPEDLLTPAAKKARQQADHPSKIVPIIIAEAEAIREERAKRAAFDSNNPDPSRLLAGPRPPRSIAALMDARGKPMSDEETGRLNEHLANMGSPARYSPDGSKEFQPVSQAYRHELDRKVGR